MYLAELHGKLTSSLERKEDILTSNVFSFFKYCNRSLFLKKYLNSLGLKVNDEQANNAEFIFWQRYEENTEPDLIIRAGNHYILFEAKYFSAFDDGSSKTKAQVIREIEAGLHDAKNFNKSFTFVAITADYCYNDIKFFAIPLQYRQFFKWTNWQKITSLVQNILDNEDITPLERLFAGDIYSLLCKKNLREYRGVDVYSNMMYKLNSYKTIFFEAKTAKFRGDFIGFYESLSTRERLLPLANFVFFEKHLFFILDNSFSFTKTEAIFFGGKDKNE